MDSPRYTVIIPMRRFRAEEPALLSLRQTFPPGGPTQILVAEGDHPARQRNAALARARGEIVVFLDNDCVLAADFWIKLDEAFARPGVEVVGGPARLRPNAGTLEQVFHALLTHTLIVATISARYAPRGPFRKANQTDLILCNLAVRRSIFEKIGLLSTRLYPNEENEWLDVAQTAGVGIYYQPALQVFRPQRATWAEMASMLLRYGMGRTRQFMVSGWRPTFHQFLPVMLLGTLAALIYWRLEVEFVALWLLASAIVAVSCTGPLSWWQRAIAGLAAPLLPLTYAVGQTAGWFSLPFPLTVERSKIVVLDERGEQACGIPELNL